jgi:hypothetical protein
LQSPATNIENCIDQQHGRSDPAIPEVAGEKVKMMDERRSGVVDVFYELIAAGNTTETTIGLIVITQLERIADALEKKNELKIMVDGKETSEAITQGIRLGLKRSPRGKKQEDQP